MKKIIQLFNKCLLFRYVSTFCIVILIFSALLIIEKSIPNNRVKANIIHSEDYYKSYFNELFQNLNTFRDRHTMIDIPGDFYHISILYLEDYKHPVSGFIEMNKDSQLASKFIQGKYFSNIEIDSDYSRYWSGHLLILKPLLTFFTFQTISKIYFVLMIITFVILLLMILKHSKLLAIILSLGAVSVNIFFTSRSDNLTHVIIISMVLSIILIKMYEKNHTKYVDLLFLLSGMITAYMDMLSCGTLPVTLPLFIYIYLHILDGKKLKFHLFLRYILLWLFGGILSYVAKWLILLLHYHGGFREHVLEPMKVRIGSGDMGRVEMFQESISLIPHYLYPFDAYILTYVFCGLGSFFFGYMLHDKKNRLLYIYLLILCMIPFIRYFFLAEHSHYHNYFTYRCFLPVVMFLWLFILLGLTHLKKRLFKKK